MTRQEELREQYEDALFTLLMEEVAVAEGEEFLRESEALRGDPEAAVPEEVIRRCRRTINRCFSRQRRRSLARQFRWVFQKASVVALLGVLLFSAVYAISPEFRVGVLNLVVETLDESTDVSFGVGSTDRETPGALQLEIGWLPDDCELFDEGATTVNAWKYYNVVGENSGILKIDIIKNDGQLTSWDTEGTHYIPIEINSLQGMVANKDGEISLTAIDLTKAVTINIWSSSLKLDDILLIAQNMKY